MGVLNRPNVKTPNSQKVYRNTYITSQLISSHSRAHITSHYISQISIYISIDISYRIVSYHIISYHTIPYHTIPYHTIPYHIISYHIISYHIIPYHIIYIISYRLFTMNIISNNDCIQCKLCNSKPVDEQVVHLTINNSLTKLSFIFSMSNASYLNNTFMFCVVMYLLRILARSAYLIFV